MRKNLRQRLSALLLAGIMVLSLCPAGRPAAGACFLLYSNCCGTVLRICKFFSFLRYEPPSAQKFWISSKNCLPYRSALALPTPPTARSCAMVAGRRTAISRRVLSLNTI